MAWNNQLAIAMPKRSLVGDFKPGFMMKLAHKDCRLALQMVDELGVAAPVGHAALASLAEGIGRGLAGQRRRRAAQAARGAGGRSRSGCAPPA